MYVLGGNRFPREESPMEVEMERLPFMRLLFGTFAGEESTSVADAYGQRLSALPFTPIVCMWLPLF